MHDAYPPNQLIVSCIPAHPRPAGLVQMDGGLAVFPQVIDSLGGHLFYVNRHFRSLRFLHLEKPLEQELFVNVCGLTCIHLEK